MWQIGKNSHVEKLRMICAFTMRTYQVKANFKKNIMEMLKKHYGERLKRGSEFKEPD